MPEDLAEFINKVSIGRVDFAPIIRAYMQRIGLVELIDQLVPTEMAVSVGVTVAGLMQDTFSGRTPLYRLAENVSVADLELLLGYEVPEGAFADHRVGRVLDRICEAGPSKIFSEVALRAVEIFSINPCQGHWDSTSVSVFGDYDCYPDEQTEDEQTAEADSKLRIGYGYSKDKRPDLKQFLMSSLCVEHNIPIIGGCHDGNESDKNLNNKLLTRIAQVLSKLGIAESAFTYVADSAMVNDKNLACFTALNDDGSLPSAEPTAAKRFFVTRLPFTYSQAHQAVQAAVRTGEWQEIGTLAKGHETASRPHAHYRACDSTVQLYGRTWRAIVVHSSAHDRRRQKRLDRQLTHSLKEANAIVAKAAKRDFSCQADAQAALDELCASPTQLHEMTGSVVQNVTYARGRPPKNQPRKETKRRYALHIHVQERTAELARLKEEAGCFVLLNNRPAEDTSADSCAQTAEQLLRTYKDQDGIERNFSFLKDPVIVNSIFLKKPERIEALGMIFLLCLLIWNLMQRQMRQHLAQTGTCLEGWDGKATTAPTAFMMTTKFIGILVVQFQDKRHLAKPLTKTQTQYLTALGLTEQIFIDPKPPP